MRIHPFNAEGTQDIVSILIIDVIDVLEHELIVSFDDTFDFPDDFIEISNTKVNVGVFDLNYLVQVGLSGLGERLRLYFTDLTWP